MPHAGHGTASACAGGQIGPAAQRRDGAGPDTGRLLGARVGQGEAAREGVGLAAGGVTIGHRDTDAAPVGGVEALLLHERVARDHDGRADSRRAVGVDDRPRHDRRVGTGVGARAGLARASQVAWHRRRGGVGVGVGQLTVSREMVFVSMVTAPFRARARPTTVAPVLSVMDVSARMLPWKVVLVPRVAELPTCQKMLQALAPLMRRTTAIRGRDERGSHLEDEDGILETLTVECEGAGDPEGAGQGIVDARGQDLAAQFRTDGGRWAASCRVGIRGDQIDLGLVRRRRRPTWSAPFSVMAALPVTAVPGDRPTSPCDRGRPRVGDGGAGEDREVRGRSERDRMRLRAPATSPRRGPGR